MRITPRADAPPTVVVSFDPPPGELEPAEAAVEIPEPTGEAPKPDVEAYQPAVEEAQPSIEEPQPLLEAQQPVVEDSEAAEQTAEPPVDDKEQVEEAESVACPPEAASGGEAAENAPEPKQGTPRPASFLQCIIEGTSAFVAIYWAVDCRLHVVHDILTCHYPLKTIAKG